MAILTSVAFCVCVLCWIVGELFKAAEKMSVATPLAVVSFFALVLLILCAGHWLAVLLGRL